MVARATLTLCHPDKREHWERWLGVSDCVLVYWWGGRKRRGGRVHICVRQGESLEGWRLFNHWSVCEWEKCDMLPANGDAASHTLGHHSVSAAGSMIFSSTVSSAHFPLSLIFTCMASYSPILYTACFLAACDGSVPFFLVRISQDGPACLIKLICLITPAYYYLLIPSLITKTYI